MHSTPVPRSPSHPKHLTAAAGLLLLACASEPPRPEARVDAAPTDLSGLAWVAGDEFLAVHDAKNPDENDRVRLSIVHLPDSAGGIQWDPVELDWPQPLGLSSDLESIARVPDSQSFLLIESGETTEVGQQFHRIFHIEFMNGQPHLRSFVEMPLPIENIEGAAVGRVGEQLVFLYAERAEGQPSTDIVWTDLQLEPLTLGTLRRITFSAQGFSGPNIRPITAIEADRSGRLFVASAYDPGDDNGPFHSVIWRVGLVGPDGNGNAGVFIDAQPERIATLDGFKVESLAIREQAGRRLELFAGTDDENYRSTLRLIRF